MMGLGYRQSRIKPAPLVLRIPIAKAKVAVIENLKEMDKTGPVIG
jgi:hypothetical protein